MKESVLCRVGPASRCLARSGGGRGTTSALNVFSKSGAEGVRFKEVMEYFVRGQGAGLKGVNTSGVNTSGVNTSGVNSSGMNSSGVNSSGVNSSGVNTSGVNTSGVRGSAKVHALS